MAPFDQQEFEVAPALKPSHYRIEPECADPILGWLRQARANISDPTRWIKGRAFSYDADNNTSGMCALGAIGCIVNVDYDAVGSCLLRVLPCPQSIPRISHVAGFNNAPATTHADVLALFDRAIAARRKELA